MYLVMESKSNISEMKQETLTIDKKCVSRNYKEIYTVYPL